MLETSNKSIGNQFEQDLARLLADAGFWVHVLQQNKAGQPADLIVAKGRYATLIDCKVISTEKGFPLSRVEENQKLSMASFCKRTGTPCWFAFRLPDGDIQFMSAAALDCFASSDVKRIPNDDIWIIGIPLCEWISYAEIAGREDGDEC